MNRTGSKILHGLLLATSGLVGSTVIASTAAMAGGPTGGHVAVGSATILNASPTQTVINQSSKKALINWNSFSVSSGSSVQFNQPNNKSLTVNRVTGADASVINGTLQANGNVWLLNANGVLFGKGSQVNVGSLLATTSDISDDDFKNGNYTFKPSANGNASVVNKGTITVGQGGSVVLSAPQVSNEGVIQANLGTVVLGGAKAFTVDMTGDNLLTYQITEPVSDAPKSANGSVANALVSNSGTIMAAGGHVLMTARAARNVEDNVINNTGMVEATTVSSHNGVIDLDAGPDGTVNNSGTLNASGTGPGQTGGAVNVTGSTVNIADGAKVDASGTAGGGTVQIGGGLHGQGTLAHAQTVNVGNATINADATNKGNGGTVAVWSDGNTNFAGNISARGGAQGGNGGQVETSGHTLGVTASAKVDTSAPLGLTGNWLLDPETIDIFSGGTDPYDSTATTANIDPGAITIALQTNNVTLEAITANGTAAINVEDNANIIYTSNHTLSLLSEGSISVNNAKIQNNGTGAINLVAGWDGATTDFTGPLGTGFYGNVGNGNVSITSTSGPAAIGSAGGQTLVAGYTVYFEGGQDIAQIGYHGAGGGNIAVLAKQDLLLSGGPGLSTVAQIGNGVADGTGPAGGVTGDIYVNVGGTARIASTVNQVDYGTVYLGNTAAQGSTETGNVTLIAKDGSIDGGFLINDLGTTAGTGGNVFIGVTGTQDTIWGLSNYTSANTFTIAAAANLTIADDIANAGTGDVNVIAGWDGHTTALTELTSRTVYGNQSGNVTIAGNSNNVSVGSAGGSVLVEGFNVNVEADGGYAQIGYHGASAGNIIVNAQNDVTVHGGAGEEQYAQIGNGGYSFDGTIVGDIFINANGSVTLTGSEGYAQIGNGGTDANGTISGDIWVTAGISASSEDDDIELSAGSGDYGYAQIGNGGDSSHSTNSGNITVSTTGAISLTSNSDYAQIGNGGWGSTGGDGDITVSAGQDLTIEAGEIYAQIGNGGENANGGTGNIAVTSNGSISLAGYGDYAQIGNGGSSTTDDADGGITISAVGDLTLTGGEGGSSQIGNGGSGFEGNVSGDIAITVGGETFIDEAGWIGNRTDTANWTASGNVSIVTGTGDISGQFLETDLQNGDLLLGWTDEDHELNGLTYNSSHAFSVLSTGNIDVLGDVQNDGTGAINVIAGWDGHTTDLSSLPGSVYGNNGSITISDSAHIGSGSGKTTFAGDNLFVGSPNSTIQAQIGYNGTGSGDIAVLLTGNLTVNFGANSSTFQIGNSNQSGNASGDVNIAVGGNAQITQANGTIVVGNTAANGTVTGSLTFAAGSITEDHNVLENNVAADLLGGDVIVNVYGSSLSFNGATYNSAHNLTLYSNGALTINSAIQNAGTGGINLSSYSGGLTINAPVSTLGSGAIDTFASGGSITLNSSINVGADSLGLQASGSIVQSAGSIQASGLNVATTGAGHSITLGSVGNEISGAISLSTQSDATIANGQTTTLGAITVGGLLNVSVADSIQGAGHSALMLAGPVNVGGSGDTVIHATGDIINLHGQSLITADALNLISDYGSIGAPEPTDPNTSYFISASINSLHAKTGSGGDLLFSSSKSYSIGTDLGGIDTGGGYAFIAASTGAITQSASGAIVTGDLDVSVGEGGFVLSNPGNDISGSLSLNTTGTGLFASSSDIRLNGISGSGFSNDSSSAGNVTVETQGNLTVISGGTFNLSGDVSLLASDNLAIDASVQNSGGGNITLVAGWDGHTTDLSSLTSSGVYGNGDSTITIGGPNANGAIAVGSKSGATNILTGNLLVSAENGNAQLGYSGQGSGNINVYATGGIAVQSKTGSAIALIGNGGAAASGLIGGDINITTQSGAVTVESAVDDSLTMIGNPCGYGSSQSGNTTINTHGGALTLVADNPGENNVGYAHIGNLTYGSTTGTSSGDITINAGAMSVEATGEASFADIGNGSSYLGSDSGALSGNIDIDVTTLSLVSGGSDGTAQARIGHLGMGGVSGDIDIATTGALSLVGDDGGLSSIGNSVGSASGSLSGNITVTSATTVDLLSTGSGQTRISSGNAPDSAIDVTAAGSITIKVLSGNNAGGKALIGNFANDQTAVGGDVSVTSTGGSITLDAEAADSFVGIGNSMGTDTGGDIAVSATAGNGGVALHAAGSGSTAQIGNGADTGNIVGNITINADSLSVSAENRDAIATVGHVGLGSSSPQSGNIQAHIAHDLAVSASGASSIAQIGNWSDVATGGGATGTIDLTAGGAASITATGDASYATIGNGGISASGFTSQGLTGGDIALTAATIDVIASDDTGSAQASIGNRGLGQVVGDLDIATTSGDITITADNSDLASVGNRGAGTTASSGDIDVFSAGDLIITGHDTGQARIAGGLADNTNISVTATGDISLTVTGTPDDLGQGTQSGMAIIGSFGNDITNAGGDIAITSLSGDLYLEAKEDGSQVIIGNGSGSNLTSGNISVTTQTGAVSIESASDGSIAMIGNLGNGNSSQSGDVTINTHGGGLTLVADNAGDDAYGYAHIGNLAADSTTGTSSGAITINAGAMSVEASGGASYADIGNGSYHLGADTGALSGNINITATTLSLTAESLDQARIGHLGMGSVTGDINIVTTGALSLVGNDAGLSSIGSVSATLDSDDNPVQGAGSGNIAIQSGTVTLASQDNGYARIESGGFTSGNIAVVATGNISLTANGSYAGIGALQSGNGTVNISVISTAGGISLLASGTNGQARIGNAENGASGSVGGTVSVSTASAANGNITLLANGNRTIALIGNSGAGANGSVGGNVSVVTHAASVKVESTADASLAMIGNLGDSNVSESGDISINTNGGSLGLIADNPGIDDYGYAHIGNMAFDFSYGSTTAPSSGNITIQAGAMTVGATGGASFAEIGNGSFHEIDDEGALSGNIAIAASSLALTSGQNSQVRIGHLGGGAVSGDINIVTTGALSLLGDNGGLSSIGSVSAPADSQGNPVQGQGSGNISVQSGAVTLASQDNGYARIESGGFTSGNVAVAATGNISLTANGSYASIGALQSGNGTVNISVISTGGGVSLLASGTKGEAQIGNAANGAPGKIGGSLSVSAGNASNGNITVSASGNGSVALIGAAGYGDTVTGDISVLAGNSVLVSGGAALTATPGGGVNGTLAQIGDTNVSLWNAAVSGSYSGNVVITAQSLDGIGSSVFNDLVGGDVTVNSLGSGTLEIDDTQGYSSTHDFLLNAGGDVLLESSLQNSGSGNLTFVSAGNVTIGGSGASGSASLGSQSGSTSVTAKNLVISAVHGNAQLGYAGAGTGAIQVNTAGDVTVQTASNNTVALIGNGGYGLTGALKGDISVFAGGNVTVQTNSSSSIADIGVIGGDGSSQSGNITIAAGGQVGVIAQNATSSAQIGNQQAGATTPSQRGDASGNIAITSGSVLISATGTNTGAVIGMGNSLLRNQNASGSISVNTGNLTISSSSTTSTGTVALLGARGYNSANSNITVTASGNVSLAAGNYGNALLGQGSYGTAAGDILVASGGTLSLNANGTASQARVGNSGVNANGNITVSATTATLANASGATSLIGGSAMGGTLTGNVTVLAGTVQGIGASIANDIIGGDFTLYTTNSGTFDVGSVGSYSSAHDLYIVSADNLSVSGSIQNAGTGDIILAAAHTITVGGANASGGVAVGSKSGTTEIEATDLLLSATNGYAQIGYHGGGSGAIDVIALGNVTISGGGSTGYYAQIGDGGYNVTGSSSAPITVTATSNIALNGGAGQEAYAQIGNGGAESNSNTGGYSETGDIAVSNSGAMALNAGTGQGSYVQIGNGGYLSGQSLNGTVTIGGNISVMTYAALGLTGGGNDAYVQIGNGGDFLNKNVANGSSGTISGEIAVAVQAPNVPGQDQLKLTAGTGANSYTQIGNGGQGENKPVAGAKVNFTISGNVTVADLTLAGSNTGANGYAQIGNGDASRTGTGNVAGSVALGQGTNLTYIPGKAQGSSAGFGNATGTGTVSGTVASSGVSAGTQGSVAAITQTSTNPVTTSAFTTVTAAPTYVQQLASIDTVDNTQGPTPLEQLSDNSEQTTVSDTVADSVGKSLGEGKTIAVSSKMLIPGLLKQIVTLTPNQPHGVPPADVDYSSWGNEALWRW
ncbi:MAG: filamentous hemagglutinin N-terminal domain-containing protein [Proteobacteria bacterium]|nr:filamentous hemagglutinin N-terminal domain-containing protein [Pseudomonadota bacterium]